MSALGKEIADNVIGLWGGGAHFKECVSAVDAAIAPLVDALREAVQWDGYDESGVPAVWLVKAEEILARAGDA